MKNFELESIRDLAYLASSSRSGIIQHFKDNGWNLDIKNPNGPDDANGDPDSLLKKFQEAEAAVKSTIESLKSELANSLRSSETQ